MGARAGMYLLSLGTLNHCGYEGAVMRPKPHFKVERGEAWQEAFAERQSWLRVRTSERGRRCFCFWPHGARVHKTGTERASLCGLCEDSLNSCVLGTWEALKRICCWVITPGSENGLARQNGLLKHSSRDEDINEKSAFRNKA